MGSELCNTCIHTKVCMKDKNLIGDVFVMGHPMMFDNDKLYKEYKEREKQGFPCEDYISSARSEIIRCKDCKYQDENWRRVSVRWLPCMDMRTGSNWYCGSAERRTDE